LEHALEEGQERRVIAPNVWCENPTTGQSLRWDQARAATFVQQQTITTYRLANGAVITPSPMQWRVPEGAAITKVDGGTHYTVGTGGWRLERSDVDASVNPPKVRSNGTWYTIDVPANLHAPDQSTTTSEWLKRASDVRGQGESREVRSNGTWYALFDHANLTSFNTVYELVELDGQHYRVEAKPENITTGSLGYKPVGINAPLFPHPPTPADIKQLGLGDCYLQAVLISIAVSNPAHLQHMLTDNGDDTVSVRFYTVDETHPNAPVFTEKVIRVNKTLPETATGQALYQGGAPWARVMQKAFAAFAQLHGQYGVAYSPTKGEGFKQIAGGVSYRLYGVFYGPARIAAGIQHTSYDPNLVDAANLQANAEVIKKLLQFAGRDQGLSQAGQVMNLNVGATLRDNVKRAAAVIGRIPANDVPLQHRATFQQMAHNLPLIVHNIKLPQYYNTEAIDIPGMNVIIGDAKTLGEGLKSWAMANREHDDVSAFYELMNNIKEGGTDTSPGQRFSYSEHAYSVVNVHFLPNTPDPQHLTNQVLSQINMQTSQVTLRNPHGKNSPNAYNAVQNDNGEFNLTLAQFFRNFSDLEYGLVRATP